MRASTWRASGAGASEAPSASGARWKQLRSPVWQAGPLCRTRYSTASASQSTRTSTTSCTCPLVSPFIHSARRERLQ